MAKDFTPDEHTVQEVNEHIAKHPEQADAIYAAEESGKARSGILSNREQGESQDAHFVTETGNFDATGGTMGTRQTGLSNEDLERRGMRLPEA